MKRFAIFALIICLLCAPALADRLPEAQPTGEQYGRLPFISDSAPDDTPTTDGTVRVLLTYPGSALTEVDVLLDGSYSIGGNPGFRFGRGSRLHVFVYEGETVLTYQGMTLHTGAGFTLTRHRTDGVNGLYIGDVPGLYEGDLTITASDGALRMVLAIYIEDYLKGVVPYEMSDSWPLEALKAQAIAARTYALKRHTSKRDYDVYDNTRDQVYRGANPDYKNAARAVRETAGVVGTYNGELYECFYSASNGGQTDLYANVFGEAGYDYLDMRFDPFDLANPASTVKTVTIPKLPTASQPLNSAFSALLIERIAPQLSAAGYDTSAGSVNIAEISDMRLHTPKFPEPSLLYTKLSVTLRVTARKAGALNTARLVGESFTIDLDIFDEVEGALGMSINVTQNELFSLRETGEAYLLSSRRFGHGLGMSQRGAQCMAELGKDCGFILSFYYPGMTFVTRKYAASIQPLIINEVPATPLPTPEPTPRPTFIPAGPLEAGQYYAVVALSNDSSTLNMRAEPSTTAPILAALMNGQTVVVLEDTGTGWVRVRVGDLSGYCAIQYLRQQ